MRYKKESVKVLSATQEWEKARMQYELDELPVRIWIDSDDPDGLKGVNVEKMQKANLARMKVRKPYRDAMETSTSGRLSPCQVQSGRRRCSRTTARAWR